MIPELCRHKWERREEIISPSNQSVFWYECVHCGVSKNGGKETCNHEYVPTGMYEPYDMVCKKCGTFK